MDPRLARALSAAHHMQPTLQAAVRVPGGIGSTTPSRMNAGEALEALDRGFDKRVDDIKPGANIAVDYGISTPASISDALENPLAYAGSTPPSKAPGININPNADRSYLAHEMGHIASQQTDIGHLVSALRENPNLSKVLLASTGAIPLVASAMEAGDDDLDTAIVASLAAASPTIIDEALASKNALGIMDNAGMRATLGQRGRLAGALMSYTAGPVLAAIAGNQIGNMLDEDTIKTI